jgi:hypothetical protein
MTMTTLGVRSFVAGARLAAGSVDGSAGWEVAGGSGTVGSGAVEGSWREGGTTPSVQASAAGDGPRMSAVPDPIARIGGHLLAWPILALSVGIGLAVIRPFSEATVGFDTQATVIYFDRIVSGTRLEQLLSTTPKPFLTLVYGLVHELTGDWRPLVWLTILAHGAAAALAAVLALRAAGLAAGLTAGLVVAGLPLLIEDAAFGNAVPWAMAGWLAAALLVTLSPARPGLAGLALLLAALCRLETLVIVAVAGLAVAWARFGPWPVPGPRPTVPRRTWLLVAIPILALPIMLLHDWLLTGDPFFWLTVSQRYSDALRETGAVMDPIERIAWFVRRYRAAWPAVILALAGLAILARRRRWVELVGLAAMGAGIAGFVVLLAARGLYAPERYVLPVDIALALAAAVGFGGGSSLFADRLTTRPAVRLGIVGGALALLIGGTLATRGGPLDADLHRVVDDVRTVHEHTATVTPTLIETVDVRPMGTTLGWLVPTAVRPRVAVDLDVPLTDVGGLSPAVLDPNAFTFVVGQRVFHDLRGDLPRGAYAVLESATEVRIGTAILSPLLVDAEAGFWVHEVTGPT